MVEPGFKLRDFNFGPDQVNQLCYGLLVITNCFNFSFKNMSKITQFSVSPTDNILAWESEF